MNKKKIFFCQKFKLKKVRTKKFILLKNICGFNYILINLIR